MCQWPNGKWILRKAFDDGDTLPESVLWRQKEQFGDGVGYSWIDSAKLYKKHFPQSPNETNIFNATANFTH